LLVIVGIASAWFFIAVIPIMIVFAMLQWCYRQTSRELQRLEVGTPSAL